MGSPQYRCDENMAGASAKPATSFDELEHSVAIVAMLANRIREVANKLVGERPATAEKEPLPPRPPGLFGDLSARAENLRYATSQIERDLDRIEAQLP